MDRKFLLMVSAAAGALILVCILFMPMFEGVKFIEGRTIGIVFLLLGIVAGGQSILLFLGKTHLLGMDESRAVNATFGTFAVISFMGLAAIIAGTKGTAIGFWLYWFAALGGGFMTLLAANPALAAKIREATKDKPSADDAASGGDDGGGAS